MAVKRRRATSPQTRGGRNAAKLRAHYHDHRIKVDGKWYNPLLDDADNPGNYRHWTHGMVEGNTQAGCSCNRCAAAGRAEAERKKKVRLANRLTAHRATVTRALFEQFPRVPGDTIADAAETVVSTHSVVSTYRGTVTYSQVPVMLALSNWAMGAGIPLSSAAAADLATNLVEELNT